MTTQTTKTRIRIQNETPFRCAYSHIERHQITFPENSRWTKQSFKDECDVNRIMAQYMKTGEIPHINKVAPQYLDCDATDFQQAMEFVAGAQTLFQELPSAIRNRFNNSPQEFVEFCSHEKNRPELAEMGLLAPNTSASIPNPTSNLSTAQNRDSGAAPSGDQQTG